LPNVSVVIGNESESPKWEFLLFAETRLCLAYFERLKRKIYNGMTTGARTKRAAHIFAVRLVVGDFSKF